MFTGRLWHRLFCGILKVYDKKECIIYGEVMQILIMSLYVQYASLKCIAGTGIGLFLTLRPQPSEICSFSRQMMERTGRTPTLGKTKKWIRNRPRSEEL